jgi:hypothetical protein
VEERQHHPDRSVQRWVKERARNTHSLLSLLGVAARGGQEAVAGGNRERDILSDQAQVGCSIRAAGGAIAVTDSADTVPGAGIEPA